MSARFDIRVVATNGRETKKILWINKTGQLLCYGWDIPNAGHFTYHESGKIHFKLGKSVIGGVVTKIPLKGFKGRVQVGSGGCNKNLSILPNVNFDYKKVRGLVWIDTRTLTTSSDSFGIDLQLVQVGRSDLIYQIPGYRNIHIFTFSDPWIVISTE